MAPSLLLAALASAAAVVASTAPAFLLHTIPQQLSHDALLLPSPPRVAYESMSAEELVAGAVRVLVSAGGLKKQLYGWEGDSGVTETHASPRLLVVLLSPVSASVR